MEIEVISKFDDFLKLEDIWNTILEKSQSDYVCLTFEWIKSWWLGFGKDKQLLILLLKDKKDIIGIAPLMIGRNRYRGLSVQEVSFIENEHSPRSDFLFTEKREEALDAVIQYLKNIKDNWNLINLSNMPKESPNYEILQNSLKQNFRLFGIKKGLQSPFIRIESDWKTYFLNRSTKFRKVLRNKINRIQRLGAYSIEKIEDVANNKEIIAKISEISKNSWKSKCAKEIISSEENKKFFEELTGISSKKGWLNIWLLNVNEVPIAYEYHLKYKNKIYGLRADFDEAYKDSSPGSVLDMHIVESAFNNNLNEYDMCGSEDFYKKNWTTSIRVHDRFIVFRDNFYGRFIYFLEFKIISFFKKFKLVGNKVLTIYKENGWKELFKRCLQKIINLIFERNSAYWYERDLSLPIADAKTTIPLEININNVVETIDWLKKNGKDWMVVPQEIDIGLKEGYYFANLKSEGIIIGCAKILFGKVFIADFKQSLMFPQQMAYFTDIYILPEYRGRRIGATQYFMNEILRALKEKGFKKIRALIPSWNTPSKKLSTNSGFTRIKHIWYFRIFGLKLISADPRR